MNQEGNRIRWIVTFVFLIVASLTALFFFSIGSLNWNNIEDRLLVFSIGSAGVLIVWYFTTQQVKHYSDKNNC